MIGAVLGTVAALGVVLVFALASSSHRSGNGCVEVNLPYSTGGAEVYQCGAKAVAMCAAVGHPGAFTGAAAEAVARQCRKAGVRVGARG